MRILLLTLCVLTWSERARAQEVGGAAGAAAQARTDARAKLEDEARKAFGARLVLWLTQDAEGLTPAELTITIDGDVWFAGAAPPPGTSRVVDAHLSPGPHLVEVSLLYTGPSGARVRAGGGGTLELARRSLTVARVKARVTAEADGGEGEADARVALRWEARAEDAEDAPP